MKKVFLLKIFVILFVAIIVVALFSPVFRTNLTSYFSAIYASILVNLTNTERANHNISELKVNALLEKAAQMKADDMATRGYFAHNTPEGKTPWYWINLVGYEYEYAGENLAVNFRDTEDVQTAWKKSPTHWYNIVNPKYTEVGLATSTGIYKGRQAVFVVQMFGKPFKNPN